MQQHVRQMMSPGLETVKLTIQHVRNRGQRMPIGSMDMREGPLNSIETEAFRDPWILANVLIVVVVDELMPQCLAEDNPDNSHKENTDHAGNNPFPGSARRGPRRSAVTRNFFPPDRIWHEEKRLENRR